MTRGYSLEQDLGLLINNPKYSDIEIVCKDKKKLHGCKAILAARSEVFDRLIYSRVGESYEKSITFSKINSSGMKVIMEYVYTGVVKEKSITKENIIEAFIAADYFQLPELQDIIMKTVKNILGKNRKDNFSPELLSKIHDTMPLTEDNILTNLLVDAVSVIPLNTIKFGRLSSTALRVLLSCTYGKDKPFITPEYEVFRYSVILVASEISSDATNILLNRLPILEHIDNFKQIDSELIPDHHKVAKELLPLIKFIDFGRIKSQILANIIELLNIVPAETILNVYRHRAMSNTDFSTDLNEFRGILPVSNKTGFVWNESACGSNLIIEDNGKVVRASDACLTHQNVRLNVVFKNQGIFEWDVTIEKHCVLAWVGVCASENINYEDFEFSKGSKKCILASNGSVYYSRVRNNYCPSFNRDNSKVTVHLDMNQRTCSFTVNGVKYPEISDWNDLPSKLHPVVALKYPGQFRIQFH